MPSLKNDNTGLDMKNIFSIFLGLVFSCFILKAQQVPQFSQNMFNKFANNPGCAGYTETMNATLIHRTQWMGFEGAPTTFNFSVESPLNQFIGVPLGVGLNIVSDGIAEFENLSLNLSCSYQLELGEGQLGLGGALGLVQSVVNGGNFSPQEIGDIAIPAGEISGSAMDFGAGLFYNNQSTYLGLSTLQITEPDIEDTDGNIIGLSRHYFVLAGYDHNLNGFNAGDPGSMHLNPSIYLKSGGGTSQLDINTMLKYGLGDNNLLWGGVSYRLYEGVVLLTGANIRQKDSDIKFGIGYDVVMSKIDNNSIEFMVGYSYNLQPDRSVKSYKNPRYL